MTLNDLIKIVDEVYPDGMVGLYHKNPGRNHGDTLAKFLAAELKETFSPDRSDAEQLSTAESKVYTAVNDLQNVRDALMDALAGAPKKGNSYGR